MEKGIEVIARYHYQQGYFVEVTTERSVLAGRDYWLCKKNSPRKVFYPLPYESLFLSVLNISFSMQILYHMYQFCVNICSAFCKKICASNSSLEVTS